MEDAVISDNFNLKGFKAPIFIISIGIVFYYTFIMKKKSKNAEADDQHNPNQA
jgi:hypothetical protein